MFDIDPKVIEKGVFLFVGPTGRRAFEYICQLQETKMEFCPHCDGYGCDKCNETGFAPEPKEEKKEE
jgi:hypothetical protein